MNTDGKSDEPIVPSTPANNGSAELSAESGEESGSTKRNDVQAALSRTQGRIEHKSRGLHGVREAARSGSTLKFTALLHHVNEDCLTEAFFNLKKRAAVGVDGITWHEYERDVEVHIANLHSRIHRGAYRAKPSRRVWIPKSDGRKRPLGIASLPWSSRRCPGHRVAALVIASLPWASRRWRTRLSNKRCCGYCRASTNKTFSASVMAFGLVAAGTTHSMRCTWRLPVNE